MLSSWLRRERSWPPSTGSFPLDLDGPPPGRASPSLSSPVPVGRRRAADVLRLAHPAREGIVRQRCRRVEPAIFEGHARERVSPL